ncbi:MAG: type II-A CRISPR-associated protein Csn2 [Anaerovoracaceae bacterium]|nr:type II-A CRISPR-associated protein Csn2 [Anaerovoracaceae bacterium]
MKLTYPDISKVFNTEDDKVNVIIIENPRLLYDWLTDINNQLAGTEGMTVVSTDNKVLPFSKYVELLCQFVPFELNKRNLISKAVNELEHISVEDYHEETLEIISTIESFLYNLSYALPGDIDFPKLSMRNIISSAGLRFNSSSDSLCERIIDYITLVREYDRDKLFILVNLRCFVSNSEFSAFVDTILNRRINIVLIENREYENVPGENRYIIDEDLCEIS